jgi:hypothetical protein
MRWTSPIDKVQERVQVHPAVRGEARRDLVIEPSALEPSPSPRDDVGLPVRDRRYFTMPRPTAHRFVSDRAAQCLTPQQ